MTWEPKNGLHDEDVDVSDEEDGDNSFTKDEKPNALGECEDQLNVKANANGSRGGAVISTWPPTPVSLLLSWLMV